MIGVDIVISTGYSHTITNEEAWDRDPFESFEDRYLPWATNVNPKIIDTYVNAPITSGDEINMELGDYSLQEFIRADSIFCEDLCKRLEAEIKQSMHNCILSDVINIVEELNKEGHHLQKYGEINIGDIPFRDDFEDDDGYRCKLRFAVFMVVTIFFRKRQDDHSREDLLRFP